MTSASVRKYDNWNSSLADLSLFAYPILIFCNIVYFTSKRPAMAVTLPISFILNSTSYPWMQKLPLIRYILTNFQMLSLLTPSWLWFWNSLIQLFARKLVVTFVQSALLCLIHMPQHFVIYSITLVCIRTILHFLH